MEPIYKGFLLAVIKFESHISIPICDCSVSAIVQLAIRPLLTCHTSRPHHPPPRRSPPPIPRPLHPRRPPRRTPTRPRPTRTTCMLRRTLSPSRTPSSRYHPCPRHLLPIAAALARRPTRCILRTPFPSATTTSSAFPRQLVSVLKPRATDVSVSSIYIPPYATFFVEILTHRSVACTPPYSPCIFLDSVRQSSVSVRRSFVQVPQPFIQLPIP